MFTEGLLILQNNLTLRTTTIIHYSSSSGTTDFLEYQKSLHNASSPLWPLGHTIDPTSSSSQSLIFQTFTKVLLSPHLMWNPVPYSYHGNSPVFSHILYSERLESWCLWAYPWLKDPRADRWMLSPLSTEQTTNHIWQIRQWYWIKLLPRVTYCIVFFTLVYLDSSVPEQTTWNFAIVLSSCSEDPKLKEPFKWNCNYWGRRKLSFQKQVWLNSIIINNKNKFNAPLL